MANATGSDIRRKLRYVLPNLVTCGGLVLGLVAISEATRGHFDNAAWFIVLCVLLDKVDGTVARLLHASSDFGVQMDSFSDLVTFGVAPGILVLSLMTGPEGRLEALDAGLLLRIGVYAGIFFYVVAAALRLAKFNITTVSYGKTHFFGVPTTMCGALVSTYVLTVSKYGLPPGFIDALPFALFGLGLLMVSRLPIPKVSAHHGLPFNIFQGANLVAVYVFGFARLFPEYLLGIASAYVLIGGSASLARGVRVPKGGPPAPAPSSPAPSGGPADPAAAGHL